MNVRFKGRVVDAWTGSNPKYPDTRFTFTDIDGKGQVKINVPPASVGLVKFDGLYDVDINVQCVNSRVMGQIMTFVSGTFTPVKGS